MCDPVPHFELLYFHAINNNNKHEAVIAQKEIIITELRAEILIQQELLNDKTSEADLILKN